MATETDPNRVSVAFIKYYYNLLNSQEDKLYQLYSKDAVLRHNLHSEPFSSNTKNIVGNENIKEHWKTSELAGAKVMIQSIDTAKSYHDSILTIAAGELALKSNDEFNDDQPSYKFVQTFVLIPTKGVYDVFSDVLTFIPDVDYEYDENAQDAEVCEKKDTAEESTGVPAHEEKKEAVPEIKKSEAVAEKGPVAPATVPETTAVVEAPVAEVSEPVLETEAPAAVSEPTPAPVIEEEATPVVSTEEKEQEEVFSPNTNTKESTPETEEEEKPAAVEKTTVKAEKLQEEVKEKKEEKPVEAPAATTTNGSATPAEKSVEASPAPESKPATPTATPAKPAKPAEPKQTGPPKPISWASLAASHKGPSSVAKVPSTTQPVVVAPQNGAASAAAKKTNFVNGRTSPSNGQGDFKKVVRNKNNKFNKGQFDDDDTNGATAGVSDKAKLKFTNNAGQEVYPVYIKHIETYINEADLKDVLEKSFGKVDSCRIDRSVALVDFTSQEAQAKAIKQHSVKVKGHEIKIEVRLRKEEKVAMFANKKKNKGKKHHSYVENDGFRKVDRK
ncbi:unnamed protein product [Ambrosiozyma monospora]|uniref:Unnamed protein product n=1 Tax=Ambrosiozyma monospora TaxID=43982 RepID=A0A9W6YS92_AMBMO|nr:unnamed protein product [Ambrosiozyma monospora]